MSAPSLITRRICVAVLRAGQSFAGRTVGTYRNDGAKRPVLQPVVIGLLPDAMKPEIHCVREIMSHCVALP
jgi:hypothetical protein